MPFSDRGTLLYSNAFTRNLENNKEYVLATAHATLTVGTLYAIIPTATGFDTAAIADNASTYRVGVALKADAAGTVSKLQVGGYYEGLTTPSLSTSVDHGLGIGGGAIIDEGAAAPFSANVFAVNVTATTTATSHNVILLNREITAST